MVDAILAWRVEVARAVRVRGLTSSQGENGFDGCVDSSPQPHDLSRIAQDLQIRKAQDEAVVQLLDDDNTVPLEYRAINS